MLANKIEFITKCIYGRGEFYGVIYFRVEAMPGGPFPFFEVIGELMSRRISMYKDYRFFELLGCFNFCSFEGFIEKVSSSE